MRHRTPEEESCLSACSMPPLARHAAGFPRRPPAAQQRGCVIRRTRPPWRRSRRHACRRRSLHGQRLRGLIVVLWRAGLRIGEALALAEADLDPRRGALLVRRGKGGRRREVGMDDWAWEQLQPWISARRAPGRAAVLRRHRPTRGRPWAAAAARAELRHVARGPASAALRPAPAAPRPCRRDGPRGRAADRHPTPARPHQPRHHLRSTSRASTTQRSSTPSTPAERRWSP